MFWLYFRRLIFGPRYVIVVGTSFATANEAARSAENQVNAARGEAIGIAADAICCAQEKAGPGGLEFNVYVLVER